MENVRKLRLFHIHKSRVVSDANFDTKIAVPALGSASHEDVAKVRRLLFESYTLTASELKRRAEHSESDAPKKIPVQEIAARFVALEKKLSPLKIESVLEPSHTLVNSVAQCLEDGHTEGPSALHPLVQKQFL